MKQDEAGYARAEPDRVQYQGLVDGGVVWRLEYDAHEAEALADSQALEADRATVTSEQHKIGQLRSLVEQKLALVQSAHTAPQQVNDAQAKSESSIGQVSQAEADVRTAELKLGLLIKFTERIHYWYACLSNVQVDTRTMSNCDPQEFHP